MNAYLQDGWNRMPPGNGLSPDSGTIVAWLFLRGLGLIYLAAFGSMATQIDGLIGSDGILPLGDALARIAEQFPQQNYWRFPTLFWFGDSDTALDAVCYAGMAAACLVVLNIFSRSALIACFLLYLSIAAAGQDFTAFQWDIFLLESGFLAIFLTWHSRIVIFLYRFLVARFMFMGGVVKIASGDPTWANLTALDYHYLTQPLPSPLAYYAYFLPEWWHKLCVAGVLFIELIVPFFVFLPRPFRLFAAWSFIVLQLSIILTGNYTFFNLLTLLLCLFLFEDRDFVKFVPGRLVLHLQQQRPAGWTAGFSAGVWGVFTLAILGTHLWMAQTHRVPPAPLLTAIQAAAAFSVVNNYGPFSVMTTERDEIIVEGSQDGDHWAEYGFKYKPDALDKPLRWNIPHQPRLDWQMWFAALESPRPGGWFENFMQRLRQGSPPVLALLAYNPFPDRPPAFLRAVLYRYTFAPPALRTATGQIWQREKLRRYWPPEDSR
ncbi:MAG: lipase maturation factor family protein [Gammaproteobacteria bacterium]